MISPRKTSFDFSARKRALLKAHLQSDGNAGRISAGIPRQENAAASPLSLAQQRLWLVTQLEPESPAYNFPAAIKLSGRLDADVFEESLNDVVRRHSALRTTFVNSDDGPVQKIAPELTVTLSRIDLRAQSAAQQFATLEESAAREVFTPFDLSRGPLLRAALFRTGADEHVFLLTLHHIVSDGWAFGLFIRDLMMSYSARVSRTPADLQELPVQYADFAVWQRAQLTPEVLAPDLAYWGKKLSGALPVLELPADRARPSRPTHRGSRHFIQLPKSLSDALKQLGRDEGATLYMTLLAAFKVLLHRYTGSSDIVVGSPIAGRNRSEVENLVGFFLNMLALRTEVSGDLTFRQLLSRVRETAQGAFAHQELPFDILVENLHPKRDLSATPLFQVMFILQSSPVNIVPPAGLALETVNIDRPAAVCDLTLQFVETPGGLEGFIEYSTDLFEKSTMAAMESHLRVLWEAIASDPGQKISSLPLLPASEQNLILKEWNRTAADYPRQKCVHQLFEEQAEKSPAAPAVSGSQEKLSFEELNRSANRLAHYLARCGVKIGMNVGICLDRSPRMIAAVLAVLKAGAAYVPLDAALPKERLASMIDDSKAAVILTQTSLLDNLPDVGRRLDLDSLKEELAVEKSGNPALQIDPRNVAYIIYTSGSTGRPKGVQVTHGSFVNLLYAMRKEPGLTAQDVVLAVTTLSFDIAGLEIFLPLVTGARIELVTREIASDGTLLKKYIQKSGATIVQATPATWHMLNDAGWEGQSGLKMLTGGEALSRDLANHLLSKGGSLWNLYGPTETTIYSTGTQVKANAAITIGSPVTNTQLYILDAYLNVAPVNVPGELFIAGDGLARGYLNRPDLTADRFIPNPFSTAPGARMYRTGDLCRWRVDGTVEYLGRIDHQVKIRGYRIELGEIESAAAAHPAVNKAVAIACEGQPGMASEKSLALYLVLNAGFSGDILEIKTFLRAKLPEYMVPPAVIFLDSFPLTPSGKVNRRALPAPSIATDSKVDFQAPRNPVETKLAAIWSEVLRVPKIGVTQDFFELGGHSLMGTRVMTRIANAFQVELPLSNLFEHPTVAELAVQIAAHRGANPESALNEFNAPIPPRQSAGACPLSFEQQGIWFMHRLASEPALYNVPLGIRLNGDLNVPALEAALNLIVTRHKALRTTFVYDGGEPLQKVNEQITLRLPLLDLSAHPAPEAEAKSATDVEARRAFNLDSDLMLRALLIRIAPREHILVLTLHHIVSDGWTLGNLCKELSLMYTGLVERQAPALPALPIEYADYVCWQRQRFKNGELDGQMAYWKSKLGGNLPVLNLPLSRTRPAMPSYKGACASLDLSNQLTGALKDLGEQHDATLFMTLLAAFQTLLMRYSGQGDILVGTPIACRKRMEVENLAGLFTNMIVLRGNLSGNPAFGDYLRQVRTTSLNAFANQELPYDKLVEVLQPARSQGNSPLFQAMFVLQNAPSENIHWPGLACTQFQPHSGTAKFDLTLSITESAGGLNALLEYNTDIFDAAMMENALRHYRTLLESIAAAPRTRVRNLAMVAAEERHLLLRQWNNTRADYPSQATVHELIQRQAALTPDAVAVVFEHTPLTYSQLNARANQLAHCLLRMGVNTGTLVGVCLDRSLPMIVAVLGVLKAGAAYVPLDPALPKDRLSMMLEDSRVPVLLTQTKLLASLPQLENDDTRILCLDAERDELSSESTENPRRKVKPGHLAYVIYTSGSTGRPKGVQVVHGAVVNFLYSMRKSPGLTPQDAVLAVTTLSFDIAGLEIFLPLVTGARVELVSREAASDGALLKERIKKSGATVLQGTPATWHMLHDAGWQGNPRLKMLCGGEALSLELASQLLKKGRSLWNMYGPTETTIWSSALEVKPGNPVVIGPPIGNTQFYILDAYLNVVPVGIPGELYIGGDGLARGYLNRPDLTAEKFIPNPFGDLPGARMYRTGDLCCWRDGGSIDYLGRIDHQVKIRGYRIELGEIEAAASAHPAISQAVATARDGGSSAGKSLVLYVLLNAESKCSSLEVKTFLRSRLPEYMVPSAVVFLEEFPLTPSGKVDRRALPAPSLEAVQALGVLQGPRNPVEQKVSEIWMTVLGVSKIDINQNFFELGGHSLLATQIVTRAGLAFQLELPVSSLFEFPTVSGLSALISERQIENAEPDEMAALLAELEGLSESQVSSQLGLAANPGPE